MEVAGWGLEVPGQGRGCWPRIWDAENGGNIWGRAQRLHCSMQHEGTKTRDMGLPVELAFLGPVGLLHLALRFTLEGARQRKAVGHGAFHAEHCGGWGENDRIAYMYARAN